MCVLFIAILSKRSLIFNAIPPVCDNNNLDISNGTVLYKYAKVGLHALPQEAIYQCFSGYELKGPMILRCRLTFLNNKKNGIWSDNPPKCNVM